MKKTRSTADSQSNVNVPMHGAGSGEQSFACVSSENTCIAMMPASGATPLLVALVPTAMPATCVPWSHPSRVFGQGAPLPCSVDCETPPGQNEWDTFGMLLL